MESEDRSASGVSRSLRADSHGKSSQSLILDIDVDADDKIKR